MPIHIFLYSIFTSVMSYGNCMGSSAGGLPPSHKSVPISCMGADWECQIVTIPTLHQWWLEVVNKYLSFHSPRVDDSELSFILYLRGSHYEWALLPISGISSLTLEYFLIFLLLFLHSLTRMCWHNLKIIHFHVNLGRWVCSKIGRGRIHTG